MARAVLAVVACLVASAAAKWAIIDRGIATTDTGIAFVDANVGYTAGGANGAGPEVFKTTTGATSWLPMNISFGIDVLLLSCAANGDAAVVTSIFGELYTVDGGKTWGHSFGGGLSQSAHKFPADPTKKKFGVTGTFAGKQGAAVTTNGGITFKHYYPPLYTQARYGAFPSDTTWYIAAGQWPDQNNSDYKRRSVFQNENGKFPVNHEPRQPSNGEGYMAQLVRTTDGGNTWTTVFAQNNTFYFNAIDCSPSDPNHCCAVGEAEQDSTQPGAQIHCTTDGKTWTRTFYSPFTTKEGFSLMMVRFASPTELWAAGGELTSIMPSAWFLHSVDGGQTWVNSQTPIPGSMVLALDMVNPSVGYASLDNVVLQQSNIAKYTA